MAKKRPRAARNIAWIETFCRVPEGDYVGMPVKLRPWQKRIISKIYDGKTRQAIISFAKKNGKTTLSAWILLLHLAGPEARPNSQIVSTGQTKKQASIIFELALKTIIASDILRQNCDYVASDKMLRCAAIGTRYIALASDPKAAQGLSPVLCLHDELGQVTGPKSGIYDATESAMSAHTKPLSIVISTQAPNDSDLLSLLIDDGLSTKDASRKVFLYTADEDLNPFTVKALKQANPAYGDFQSEAELKLKRNNAKRMSTEEASYRNFNLNQRISAHAPYISKKVWQSCAAPVSKGWGDAPVFAGLDLSSTTDLTAFVMLAKIGQFWESKSVFWAPEDGLLERAARDRVEYDVWHKQGLLQLTPGPIIEYEWVAHAIKEYFNEFNFQTVAFDLWNWKHLKPWLSRAGFPENLLDPKEKDAKFLSFGQGYRSMSPALRTLEEMVLNKRLKHGGHPILTHHMTSAKITKDPAGNRKLDKSKTSARIDGAVALAMAASAAALYDDSKPEYQVMVF